MSFFGKLKDLAGIDEIDDDEISEEEIKAADSKLERTPIDRIAPQPAKAEVRQMPSAQAQPTAPKMTFSTNAFKLIVIEPKSFDECPKLVDNLKAKKPIIINLEKIEADVARKIFDFLSGATYALNGNVQKVANNIFVFAPENVDVTATVDHKSFSFNETNNKNPWR